MSTLQNDHSRKSGSSFLCLFYVQSSCVTIGSTVGEFCCIVEGDTVMADRKLTVFQKPCCLSHHGNTTLRMKKRESCKTLVASCRLWFCIPVITLDLAYVDVCERNTFFALCFSPFPTAQILISAHINWSLSSHKVSLLSLPHCSDINICSNQLVTEFSQSISIVNNRGTQ
jgi:hypothetical protein